MPQFTMRIELRGLVVADNEETAMQIAKEQAALLARNAGDILADHLIDETEATSVTLNTVIDGNF